MAKKSSKPLKRNGRSLSPAKFRQLTSQYLRVINSRAFQEEDWAEKLRSYHAVGRVLREYFPDRSAYARNLSNDLAKSIGRERHWLYGVHEFARAYMPRQLNELCRHAGAIHWGHVRLLLFLKPEERRAYQKKIVENGWTTERLWREMQKRRQQGKPKSNLARKPKGRPLGGSTDPRIRWQYVTQKAKDLIRVCGEGLLGGRIDQKEVSAFEQVPAGQLRDVQAALKKLQAECSKVQGQLGKAIAQKRR